MSLAILMALALMQEPTPPADPLAEALTAQARSYQFTRPSAGIHFSPRAAATYAMTSGCLPAVITGQPAATFFETAMGRSPDVDGRHTVSTAVSLLEQRAACTVTSDRGDPEELRAAILAALDEAGVRRTTASDSGAGSRDANGPFRQELHCLVVDGEQLFLVMSTSSARNRLRLMASLGRDGDGGCARRVSPPAP
jgi:hypothetical protein